MKTLFLTVAFALALASTHASAAESQQYAEVVPFYENDATYIFPSRESALKFMREFRFWSFLRAGTGVRPVAEPVGYDGWCAMGKPAGFPGRVTPGCVIQN